MFGCFADVVTGGVFSRCNIGFAAIPITTVGASSLFICLTIRLSPPVYCKPCVLPLTLWRPFIPEFWVPFKAKSGKAELSFITLFFGIYGYALAWCNSCYNNTCYLLYSHIQLVSIWKVIFIEVCKIVLGNCIYLMWFLSCFNRGCFVLFRLFENEVFVMFLWCL